MFYSRVFQWRLDKDLLQIMHALVYCAILIHSFITMALFFIAILKYAADSSLIALTTNISC